MRTTILSSVLLAAATAVPAAAQVAASPKPAPRAYAYSIRSANTPRAVIGVTMATGDANDTLGIRIIDVSAGSPAAKAGIEDGDRLQAINGVNLKLSAVDLGDDLMADAMSSRLTRELGKLKPGDDVTLKVYHSGTVKSLTVKTVSADDLYDTFASVMKRADNRAVLGVSLTVTGSKRDTLGILIIGVNDDGPAAKAGLEEGNRIAAINGVNLRVDRADAGDRYVSSARYQRLQNEMEKVKPGDNVSLQVYADGRFKTVQLKATRSSDLKGDAGVFVFDDGGPGRAAAVRVDAQRVREDVQRAMDQARRAQDMQHVLDQARRAMDEVRVPGRVVWMDDAPPAPAAPKVIRMESLVQGVPVPPVAPVRVVRGVRGVRVIRF